MSNSIGTTPVQEVMNTVVLTSRATDKMEAVAKVFQEHNINSAPVVDESGKCVGIITSHDLVEYEASRKVMQNELNHGYYYNLAHYGDGNQAHIPGLHFDEVGFHMTKTLETVDQDAPLSRAARAMCQKHIHHIIVIDENQQPTGILSSLDILGHLLGEPVTRPTDPGSTTG